MVPAAVSLHAPVSAMAVAGIGIQRVLGYTFVVSGLVCGIALLLLD